MVNKKDICKVLEETNSWLDNNKVNSNHQNHIDDCSECDNWIKFSQRLNHSICLEDPDPKTALVWHQISKSIPKKKVSWFEYYLPKIDMELIMICSMAVFFIIAIGSVQHSIQTLVPNQTSSIIHMDI